MSASGFPIQSSGGDTGQARARHRAHPHHRKGNDVNRRLVAIALFFATLAVSGPAAHAAGGNFGLGVILGEPTGISAKLWMTRTNALQFGVAWSFSGDTELHVQGDYLMHFFNVIDVDKGRLPLFAGLGGRIRVRDEADNKVGLRIPVGLAYHFASAPFDIFGEIVPILDLAPDTDFEMEGAIGAHFYF